MAKYKSGILYGLLAGAVVLLLLLISGLGWPWALAISLGVATALAILVKDQPHFSQGTAVPYVSLDPELARASFAAMPKPGDSIR